MPRSGLSELLVFFCGSVKDSDSIVAITRSWYSCQICKLWGESAGQHVKLGGLVELGYAFVVCLCFSVKFRNVECPCC